MVVSQSRLWYGDQNGIFMLFVQAWKGEIWIQCVLGSCVMPDPDLEARVSAYARSVQ